MTVEPDVSTLPTIVLVGGCLVLEDGTRVDSLQGTTDAHAARAVHKALIGAAEWWEAVVSVVIPTLDDERGGFALADMATIARTTLDGRTRRVKFPRHPRPLGGEDYIHNLRTLDEARKMVSAARKKAKLTGSANELPDHSWPPRVRIHTTLDLAWGVRVSAEAQLIVLPDTLEVRRRVDLLLDPNTGGGDSTGGDQVEATPWNDPGRRLRLSIKSAACRVSGLVLAGQWCDPSGLEAARRLLLERFDLKVGLWDLALNPILRSTVLEPASSPRIPEAPAEVPAVARRRAAQETGGVAAALVPGLSTMGWVQNGASLQHSIIRPPEHRRGDPEHPYLRMLVDPHRIRVLAWNWHYNRFDINAFADARRDDFDAIATLPARRRVSPSSARTLAKFRKPGDVVYGADRLMDDTRWVLLWVADKGWADLETDWSSIAAAIAERTPRWVTLLADAVALALGVGRTTLQLVVRGNE